MRRMSAAAVERPHFRGEQAFGARTETRQHRVARLRVGEAVTPQRLHMDEDVLGALAAGQEAEAARAVEPFDDDDLEAADIGRLRPEPRRRQLRRLRALARGDGR